MPRALATQQGLCPTAHQRVTASGVVGVYKSGHRENNLLMPILKIPNSACFHTLRNFLDINRPFENKQPPAILQLHPRWLHMDPMSLAMTAAWGGWCQRNNIPLEIENLADTHATYAARMKLFQHLGISFVPAMDEKEEAGRFMPITNVKSADDVNKIIGNVSALLHLDKEPNGLAALRYCISELVRNVLEHSGSPEGAYVCAQRYVGNGLKRVSIAVADCGAGILAHLSKPYPEVKGNDMLALSLAMRPGITGAATEMYGAPNNAGVGLFFTRAIAKATGGYFVLISGNAAFRLRRQKDTPPLIYYDAFDDAKKDVWGIEGGWTGTVAAMEIVTQKIADFPRFFAQIRSQLPTPRTAAGKIKFT